MSSLPEQEVKSSLPEQEVKVKKLYFDYAYAYDYLTLAVPFMISLVIFYVVYWAFFKSYSHRIRTKMMVIK